MKLMSQAAAQEQVKVLQKASATKCMRLKLSDLNPQGTIIHLTHWRCGSRVMSGSRMVRVGIRNLAEMLHCSSAE